MITTIYMPGVTHRDSSLRNLAKCMGGLLLLLFIVFSHQVRAQSQDQFFSTDRAQLIYTNGDVEERYESSAIYTAIFPNQNVFRFRTKTTTFLENAPVTGASSDRMNRLLNTSGNAEMELAGQLPDGHGLVAGKKNMTYTVKGMLKLGGISRSHSFKVTMSYDGKKVTYHVDTMIDAKAWGLQVPETKGSHLMRFIFSN